MMGVLINETNARHNDGRLLLCLFMGNPHKEAFLCLLKNYLK